MSFPTGYLAPSGDAAFGHREADACEPAPLTRRQLRERERAATAALEVTAPPAAVPGPAVIAERETIAGSGATAELAALPASDATGALELFAALGIGAQPAAVVRPALEPLGAPETRRQRRERDTAEIAVRSRAGARASKRAAEGVAVGQAERTAKRANKQAGSRRRGDIVPVVPRAPVPVRQSIRLRTPNADAHPPVSHARSNPARKRRLSSFAAMLAAAGLVTTFALPAYAISSNTSGGGNASLAGQTLSVANVVMPASGRENYTTIENVAAWDSTLGTTVPSTVQALAAKIMSAAAAGRLTGSTPNHLPEIQNLAAGVAVPGCGVDYRVLQVIEVALDNFSTVGVSDINRRCTGQIEGAGTASAHYADGGGHAVDFDMLNGQSLNGGDANSVRLIRILDPLVPPGSHVGQQECRSSISLTNLVPFDDTCDHLHIDFGQTTGASLRD